MNKYLDDCPYPLETLSVVGHSLGGIVARGLAVTLYYGPDASDKIWPSSPLSNPDPAFPPAPDTPTPSKRTDKIFNLKPCVYMTFFTPHLGLAGPFNSTPGARVVKFALDTGLKKALAASEMVMSDATEGMDPILQQLSRPEFTKCTLLSIYLSSIRYIYRIYSLLESLYREWW